MVRKLGSCVWNVSVTLYLTVIVENYVELHFCQGFRSGYISVSSRNRVIFTLIKNVNHFCALPEDTGFRKVQDSLLIIFKIEPSILDDPQFFIIHKIYYSPCSLLGLKIICFRVSIHFFSLIFWNRCMILHIGPRRDTVF